MLIDQLLAYLFEGRSHLLEPSMAAWLSASRRFVDFVADNRDKIRKKLRVVDERESLHDLRLELETAYLLLRERPLSVTYEPLDRAQGRSPDFAVSFTTSLTFMVEVTRLRAVADDAPALSDAAPPISQAPADRIADAICSKLGQLLPQRSNIVVIGVEAAPPAEADLRAVMLRVQQRAERNDQGLFRRHGLRDRADFFQRYRRLSEVLVRAVNTQSGRALAVWINPQAKHPLPSKVRTVLHRSQMI
jgi:hypothetical protein